MEAVQAALWLVILLVVLALAFDFMNGFHDAPNSIATVVSTGVLKPATAVHRLLQALMGWPAPAYAHHRLLADPAGRRLAKRDGATTLRSLRASGLPPAAVRALAGWPDGVAPAGPPP